MAWDKRMTTEHHRFGPIPVDAPGIGVKNRKHVHNQHTSFPTALGLVGWELHHLSGLVYPPVGKHRVDGILQAGPHGIGEQLRVNRRRHFALGWCRQHQTFQQAALFQEPITQEHQDYRIFARRLW